MDMRSLVVILLLLLPPNTTSSYSCDDSVNFIHSVTYNQISLTDGCSSASPPVCNSNPVYVPECVCFLFYSSLLLLV